MADGYSYATRTGDGTTTAFSFSFDYLEQAHVSVAVDGTPVAFSWLTASSIQITPAPAAAASVVIRRTTPKSAPLVTFQDGPTLPAGALNRSAKQALFIAQETLDAAVSIVKDLTDGAWDAGSARIKNVGAPSAAHDAVTKEYADALAVVAGNVPPPGNPSDDEKVLRASGGSFAWSAETQELATPANPADDGKFLRANAGASSWQSLPAADDATAGVIRRATTAEAVAGSEPAAAVTPVGGAEAYEPRRRAGSVRTVTSSTTLVLDDEIVDVNSAGAANVTVPPNSSVAAPANAVRHVWQIGAGQVTFVPGAGVSLLAPENKLKTRVRYSAVTLRRHPTLADTWYVNGDTA